MLAIGVNHNWDACLRKGSTQAPCCILFTFIACYPLQITLSQNYLLPIISVLAENTLLKTACHFLLLLVGFDTLTYRKDYDRSRILVGHQATPHLRKTSKLPRWQQKNWTNSNNEEGAPEDTLRIIVMLVFITFIRFAFGTLII
jgi:hypothetical protein